MKPITLVRIQNIEWKGKVSGDHGPTNEITTLRWKGMDISVFLFLYWVKERNYTSGLEKYVLVPTQFMVFFLKINKKKSYWLSRIGSPPTGQ